MSLSFRFVPPDPPPGALSRPRLLRSLVGRWQHRVTSLVGGPGLGKTTLLAQAIAENLMAPRGVDLWIGVEEQDADADRFARVVATALAGDDEGPNPARSDSTPDPRGVAEALWHRAPTEACIVLDDVHHLPVGSSGAAWLSQLIEVLPTNGHVVFASRNEPPIPLTRVGVQGAVLRLDEADLRFDDAELAGFAAGRGLDPERFGETGGWPAMAAIAASVEQRFTGRYLWEEVLEPLGTVRRHVLSVLSDLGGADDRLMSAALGTPVDLDQALDGVPLVGRGADGWHVAHGLWRTAPTLELDPRERTEIRRRAVADLTARSRFDEAFRLLQEVELWEEAPTVLRSACLTIDRLYPNQLGRWLAASTDSVRTSLPGQLSAGLHAAYRDPNDAIGPLQEAWTRARAEEDVDSELAAMAQLGQIAWWRQDLDALWELGARVLELEPSSHPVARAMAAIARAMLADLDGDDLTMVAELGGLDSSVLDTIWEISAGWLCGVVLLDLGQVDEVAEIVERLGRLTDSSMRHIADALRMRMWWRQGRVDEVVAQLPSVIAAEERSGAVYGLNTGQVLCAVVLAHAGDAAAGRRWMDDASATVPETPDGAMTTLMATGTATVLLAEGDEAGATAVLRAALETHGFDQGQDRRSWRQVLATSYVLMPETRDHWISVTLRGYLDTARRLAAAVVALRAGHGESELRSLDLSDLGLVRAALHYRLAAELAVGLTAMGLPEGRALLELLGAPGRAAVQDLAATKSRLAKPARSLLATVPPAPPRATYLGVLGPLMVRRDGPEGDEVVHHHLRHRRVQALLAFVVGHRRTTRSAIIGALWPDLHERAASNNLAVTLNHLLRVLEPWREPGAPAHLLRVDGPSVHLVTSEHLRIDLDDFDEHLAAAARAEADGTPSVALDHHLAAVNLYRDHLFADLPEADWFDLDRQHHRARFVRAAVRAGQLLLGRGDADQAAAVANRALAADPWAEDAYAVVVGAALARRDRIGAQRLLTRCLEALADLGVDPSPITLQLQRRVQGVAA